MIRFLLFAASVAVLAGCDTTTNLVGTWNGEMPEGKMVKTPKGDFRPNMIIELRADHTFHASVTVAVMDGDWEQSADKVVLHPRKTTINGQDFEPMRMKMKSVEAFLPAEERAALQTYDPAKPWELKIQNGGKTLFLASRAPGAPTFTFRKAN